MGTVPIVGATIPMAVGAALAANMDGRAISRCRTSATGRRRRGCSTSPLTSRAMHNLPVLFACENNLFASHLHISLRQPKDSACRYAEAHRIRWTRVDGNDVIAVAQATGELVAAMRAGGKPGFIEAVTYRWRGHVRPREDEDVGVRREGDLGMWKERDPLRRLATALLMAGSLRANQLAAFEEEAGAEVAGTWAQAEKDPFPPADALTGRAHGKGAVRLAATER